MNKKKLLIIILSALSFVVGTVFFVLCLLKMLNPWFLAISAVTYFLTLAGFMHLLIGVYNSSDQK